MPAQPDPKTVSTAVPIRDFPGLVSNADAHDIPPGAAQVQVNATGQRPGELAVRPGFRRLRFDEE
jgi:hypothetical protein